jgi:AcrR family transcriptional regulator
MSTTRRSSHRTSAYGVAGTRRLELSGEPGTPRTTRGERTAARLRGAAREVFAERGYAAARVEDIVAEAGVSHGTFYTYFENKGKALDALIDETAAELQAVVDEPWEGADVLGTIAAVIDRFVAVFADHADVVRAWLEAGAHEQHFRDRLREVRQGYVDRVADNLEPALADTDHDASVAAAALVAMVEGYATQGMATDDPDQRASVVSTLSAIWFGGLLRLVDPTV